MHIGHCWRQREEIARGEVIEAVWHPHYPEVLGLYIEGVVFKWRPYEDEVEEIVTGASRLAISKDGNLFATGDVRGTVKVYTTSDFGLLYQLASEDTVLGLAFSPDPRRFYDIRGYYGNAWEPNSLVKFAEQRGRDVDNRSETESLAQSSAISVNRSQRIDSVTALASSPIGHLYCCGTDKGTVRLHHTQRGKLADIYTTKSFLSIERMAWGNDGRYFCFSDSSKKLVIMSITLSADHSDPIVEMKAEMLIKNSANSPISQLLFHPQSSQLFVYSSSTIHTISLMSFSVTQSLELATSECKWIIHPRDPTLVMGIGPGIAHILDWNLSERQTYKIDLSIPESMLSNPGYSAEKATIDQALVTNDKEHVLVQLRLGSQNTKDKVLFYFSTSSISTSTVPTTGTNHEVSPITVESMILPQDLSSEIALSLSLLPHDRLVFLSRAFSVCTCRIQFSPGPLISSIPSIRAGNVYPNTANSTAFPNNQRRNDNNIRNPADKPTKVLFSLPGDWISRGCLALCSIWEMEKSLLCPKNGEVAIVRCAALI